MKVDKNELRRDRTALVAALEQAGAQFKGNACRCPFHPDKTPSGGIYEKEGVWKYKCLACGVGGDVFDMRSRLSGSTVAQVMREAVGIPERPRSQVQAFANMQAVRDWLKTKVGDIVGEYPYTTPGGDVVQVVFRCAGKDGKTFRPVHLTDAGYVLGACPTPRPLYNLPKVTQGETVVVVEGEKCSDILARYGFTATTSPAGAKNARHADWTPLAGKAVTLWPDNDSEGRRYMADVEQILEGLSPAPRVSILDPASLDLGDGEDVADFAGQLEVLNKTDAEITGALAEALKKANLRTVAGELAQRMVDISAGRYTCIEWPWDSVNRLTRALLPGTVTLLVGNPGASKSFMALQAFSFWHEQGLRVSLYEAEEDKVFHLTRVLAQKSGQANVTDPAWVKDNAELVGRTVSEHKGFLDSVGRMLHANAETQPTLAQLSEWVTQQAKSGCRIIGIDPVTAAERGGDPWVVDSKFLQAIKRTATDYRCSVVLVTHPVKSVSYPDLSQVAGSAAYQRFSQTILWLESHDLKTSKVKACVGTTKTEHDRTLHILKARNGKGMGFKLAFEFDSESLTLDELGVIVKERRLCNHND
jgi:hypothetical protein